jgi:predicted enzyme related to lactoylglutathione lyase
VTERVLGIGGFFFRAEDPAALARWYEQHLGIECAPDGDEIWQQEAGLTVFAPFPADTEYFGRRDQQTMLNFRVGDLDAMLSQLRGVGADVDAKVEDYDYGRFGWVTDPEGNRIELWEPKG